MKHKYLISLFALGLTILGFKAEAATNGFIPPLSLSGEIFQPIPKVNTMGPIRQLETPFFELSLAESLTDDDLIMDLPKQFKDKVKLQDLRLTILTKINENRAKNGLGPLVYDTTAEQAGDIQVKRSLDAKYFLGHYSPNGDLPYMRYTQAGGYDKNTENAAWSVISMQSRTVDPNGGQDAECMTAKSWDLPQPDNIQENIAKAVSSLHCEMYLEKPPEDGHRQAILDPLATGVGISVGVGIWPKTANGQTTFVLNIFLYEEFVTKGLISTQAMPVSIQLNKINTVLFSAQVMKNLEIAQAQLFFENPVNRTPEECGALNHYSLPDVFDLYLKTLPPGYSWPAKILAQYPTMQDTIMTQNDMVNIPLKFPRGPGVYTLLLLAKEKTSGKIAPVTSRSIYVLP